MSLPSKDPLVEDAKGWRTRYLRTQAARWLILSEQGQQDRVQDLHAEILDTDVEKEWRVHREHAYQITRDMRDGALEVEKHAENWAYIVLKPYVAREKYWRPIAAFLQEDAIQHFDSHCNYMEQLIKRREEEDWNPTQIAQYLSDFGLNPDFLQVESLLASNYCKCEACRRRIATPAPDSPLSSVRSGYEYEREVSRSPSPETPAESNTSG